MAAAIRVRFLVDARAAHHVEVLLKQEAHHGRRHRRVVGVVTVHQDVHVGLDVGEHAADHIAFALQRLGPHDGAAFTRHPMVLSLLLLS